MSQNPEDPSLPLRQRYPTAEFASRTIAAVEARIPELRLDPSDEWDLRRVIAELKRTIEHAPERDGMIHSLLFSLRMCLRTRTPPAQMPKAREITPEPRPPQGRRNE